LEQSVIELFLPEGILEYFDLTSVEKSVENYTLYLAEKNLHPAEFSGQKLSSKGYFDEITVSDFPIRGKACFLRVKRRKWLNEDTHKLVSRNWELVAKGTRMTQEFASFLKAVHRYQSGKL
jgi:hypothetical protein